MSIRAVMFDLGGVLLNILDAKIRYTKWETLLGLQAGELFQILKRSGFIAQADVGKFSEQEMVSRLGTLLGLDDEQAGEFLGEHGTQYELNRELTEFLKRLRPRYETAILSNVWPDTPKKVQERYHFDELVDIIIYSCEEGIAKPEPGIYHLACERLGVLPEEVVFLDDTAKNVEGARHFGIRAVLFQHNAQAIADVQAYLDALQESSGLSDHKAGV